ncbi:hypothetical protein QJS04_geneDACA021528 [Acorus gramineus]|uniref:Uncharacterized protein n=1 Tax=Acorus gramineus TaxID=55184 RepID=A0AAV9A1H2_ACOGR|nr:hypothetical protein QJS04_geneDACA021528 [Acorus gramineus]
MDTGKEVVKASLKKVKSSTTTINMRCMTTRTVDVIKEWELNEKPMHVEAIRSTPFGRFIDVPPMRTEKCLLETILSFWNPQRERFVVKGRELRFTASDVAVIFGLSARGKPVDLDNKSPTSAFYHQYFTSQNEKYLTVSAIEKVMKALVAQDDDKSRIPVTEKSGRVHTSAVSVVILPQADEVDIPS